MLLPDRLKEVFRKSGHIPAWLLTSAEYRAMSKDPVWKRKLSPDGSFAFYPRLPERGASKEARVESNVL